MDLTYGNYLKIVKRLRLRQPRSEPEEHDEMLFNVIHQVYEPWFGQILLKIMSNDTEGALLCELFIDIDEGMQEWHCRHVMMAERTIGNT